MALSDYALCQECGGKAFYDANLGYDDEVMPDGTPLPEGAGFMFVLCDRCCDNARAGELLAILKDHLNDQ
jgi:hypothetical protein